MLDLYFDCLDSSNILSNSSKMRLLAKKPSIIIEAKIPTEIKIDGNNDLVSAKKNTTAKKGKAIRLRPIFIKNLHRIELFISPFISDKNITIIPPYNGTNLSQLYFLLILSSQTNYCNKLIQSKLIETINPAGNPPPNSIPVLKSKIKAAPT